ncbi:MAG TPA: LamG-like jellyroll fold domain-containing protein, partial [Clostridia bacterium]|nr:LamG-like jellyroll fold domain-containing protein [Clostridia bacterium]
VTGYYLPFSGLIDEVCLFNRALSEQEIRAVYESDFTGMCLAPPVLLTQPASQSVPMGEDAVFTVSVQGTRPLSYQWRLNGVPLPSKANGPSFIIERVSFNRLGSYSVSVSNEAGSALSSNAVLTILPPLQCTESPPGLISWWPAENSGIDAAGTNHVNFSYPASYITGKVGQAFSQIFQSTRIQVPNPNALNFGSNADFSIEAWIKALPASFPPRAPYNPYTNTVIALKRLSTGQSSLPGYALSLCHGQLTFWLKAFPAAVTAPAIQVSGGPDLRDSMFHHVAVSLDRDATDGGKLYVDAQLVLTFDPTPHSGSLSNVYPFLIGSVNESYPATSFNGLIDEMAVYGRALTREEIAAVRNAGSAGRCKPLPPLITTAAATSITSTSAVLNAALNSRGMVATAWFDWGSGVISNSSPNQICAGSNQAIALQLTGLTPGQTYCFRAHATNSGGVSLGEEFAFSWSPARPHLVPATSAVADSFAVEFYGEPCQLYLLQASTNLVDWTSLGTPAALDSGRFRFVDPGSDTFGSRFYRIIAP